MAKKAKKGSSVVGKIITVVLLVLLVAGGYYLFNLFKSIDITPENMTGTWKDTDGDDVIYWAFEGYSNKCGIRNDVEPTDFEDSQYTWKYIARGSGKHYEKTITGKLDKVVEFDYYLFERNAKKSDITVYVMRIQPTGFNKDGSQVETEDITINAVSHAQIKYMKGTGTYTSWTRDNIF